MFYIVKYHYSLAIQRYKRCVCTVWETTDITFRREHRKKAPHHSCLSLRIETCDNGALYSGICMYGSRSSQASILALNRVHVGYTCRFNDVYEYHDTLCLFLAKNVS